MVTGEGGMVLARREEDAARIKTLALHGMSKDAWKRFGDEGYRHYYVVECGFKYNMMDLQAAIGIHQLARVEANWQRRRAIWERYDEAFADLPLGLPAAARPGTRHALAPLHRARRRGALRHRARRLPRRHDGQNIGVGVHYLSIPEHPFYSERFGWRAEDYPQARAHRSPDGEPAAVGGAERRRRRGRDRGRGQGGGGVTPIDVAHSFDVWLPLTMTWAYNQVRYADGKRALVLTGSIVNRERFPWEPVYAAASSVERARVRVLRRAGRRAYPRAYGHAFRDRRPQVLHSHFGYRGWADLPLARRFGPAHVVTFYGHDVTMFPRTWPVWRGRYAELFAAADLFLCEGPFMAGSLVELGCAESKVRVQRLGVELDRLPWRPRVLRDEGRCDPHRRGFRPKKGIPAALEAVAFSRARGSGLRVTVVGDSGGTPIEEAERAILEGVVRRLASRTSCRPPASCPTSGCSRYARHHLFLSPSGTAADGDSEGGAPVAIIETAATGMPVVSTTHCDIPEVVMTGTPGSSRRG